MDGFTLLQKITYLIGALAFIPSFWKYIEDKEGFQLDKLKDSIPLFEKYDPEFLHSFVKEQYKQMLYQKITGIGYEQKAKVDWLNKHLKRKFSWTYLSLALPYLIIEPENDIIKVKTGWPNMFLSVLSFLAALGFFLLLILCMFFSSETDSLKRALQMLTYLFCIFIFLFGAHPYIFPRVIKKNLKNNYWRITMR